MCKIPTEIFLKSLNRTLLTFRIFTHEQTFKDARYDDFGIFNEQNIGQLLIYL